MALKDILVHVDATPSSDDRVRIAVELAAQHQAHLVGLHVKPELVMPLVEDYSALPESYFDDFVAEIDAAARAAETKFTAAVKKSNIEHEWRVARGFASDVLRRQARYSDLVIVGQRNPDADDNETPDVPENMLLDTGRPTLIIPYIGTLSSFAKRVMIAWDDGAPATRAVHDAVPLMKDADQVDIIAVNPTDTGDHGPIPCADISLHLARHGIKAEAQSVQASDVGVADILLARAFDHGCDLLVMGAYGHSRWRELVLGGVTQHMLENMTMPVLMSH
jgi:nucleotide-binding universal stress UspA family protein